MTNHLIGTAIADHDAAHREDIDLIRQQRDATAKAWAGRIADMSDLLAAMKTDAAAQDADFAKAIARREAMLGEPQSFRMAAE